MSRPSMGKGNEEWSRTLGDNDRRAEAEAMGLWYHPISKAKRNSPDTLGQ